MVQIACPCPPRADGGARHPDGDEVTLRERLGFQAGMTARNAVQLAQADDPGIGSAEVLTILTEVYVLHGVESWTLVDDKGKPLPVTRPNIRQYLLSDLERAMTVGDAADELYAGAVMVPLLEMGSRSSPDTPTERSTSPTSGSQPGPRRQSRRSSTTTSRTDGIAQMSASPGGDSSSSLS